MAINKLGSGGFNHLGVLGTVGVPPPPTGFVYLTRADGTYLTRADGTYLLRSIS